MKLVELNYGKPYYKFEYLQSIGAVDTLRPRQIFLKSYVTRRTVAPFIMDRLALTDRLKLLGALSVRGGELTTKRVTKRQFHSWRKMR